jgi:hypothetical protein
MTGFRIPRPALFAVAALIQAALIAAMVVDRARILREGTEITLHSRAVDPRDFLRGDYVALGYDISSVKAGAIEDRPSGGPVFVKLAPGADGFYQMVSVHDEPVVVSPPEVLIRGRVTSGAGCGRNGHAFCDSLRLRYGLERYFVPQGEGLAIESARNAGKVAVVAAVAADGRAAIKRLVIDGQPVYDEPLF